jgi:hypothetical protein
VNASSKKHVSACSENVVQKLRRNEGSPHIPPHKLQRAARRYGADPRQLTPYYITTSDAEIKIVDGDPKKIGDILKKVKIKLPDRIFSTELEEFQTDKSVLGQTIQPDLKHFDYYVIQIPLSIFIRPESKVRADRVELNVDLLPKDSEKEPLPCDIYPTIEGTKKLSKAKYG